MENIDGVVFHFAYCERYNAIAQNFYEQFINAQAALNACSYPMDLFEANEEPTDITRYSTQKKMQLFVQSSLRHCQLKRMSIFGVRVFLATISSTQSMSLEENPQMETVKNAAL